MPSPMRFAIHVPHHPDAPWAERELALRVAVAMEGLGWEHRILHRVADIEAFEPIASLCMHPQMVPKMSAVPSLACHWNPPELFNNSPGMWRNSLTHDAYLVGSPQLAARLVRESGHGGPPVATLPFYPSSQGWALPPRLDADSRFFYIGSNWDGRRYPLLLDRLASRDFLAVYGQANRWQHMKNAFVASLPFDGRSVIEQANLCGMGLCLHLPMHFNAGLPNMRIFELCAAGALIVADRHPFVVQNFGDSVLYVDMSQGEEAVAEQILEHGRWARTHWAQGREMALAAQAVFLKHFSLERLLAPLPDLVGAKSGNGKERAETFSVSVVLPVAAGADHGLEDRLNALAKQDVQPKEIILCGNGVSGIPEDFLESWKMRINSNLAFATDSTESLFSAVKVAKGDWLIVLPKGASPFPQWLSKFKLACVYNSTAAAFSTLVLEPGPDLSGDVDERTRFLQPYLDWRLCEAACLNPAATIMRKAVCMDALSKLESQGCADIWNLMREIENNPKLYKIYRVLARIADGASVPERFRKIVQPSSADQSDVPWTGHSDLEAETVQQLPRLKRAEDFAKLPASHNYYIYGASRGGELLYFELKKWRQVQVAAFIDSQNAGEKLGLPVFCVENISFGEMRNAVIIVANQYVSSCYKKIKDVFPESWNSFVVYNAYPHIYEHSVAEERAGLKL